jgi:hypothetical protein
MISSFADAHFGASSGVFMNFLLRTSNFSLSKSATASCGVLNPDLEIKRMKGDHIIINKQEGFPSLKRPIVLVNEKRLSNAVRLNLLKECEEIGIKKEEFEGIF